MTPGQLRALTSYVTRLQHELKLDHWDVTVLDEAPEPDEGGSEGLATGDIEAQTMIEKRAYVAKMRFSPKWVDQTPDVVRHLVVHELLHLHTDLTFSDAVDAIEGLAGAQANALAAMLIVRSYERMTDALAAAIAPHYDLPTWPDQ